MINIKKLLSEEFVDTFKTRNNKLFELYKNPGSLHEFDSVRGIIVSNGDLYIGSGLRDRGIIHSDIIRAINEYDSLGIDIKGNWHISPRNYGLISVQQRKSTNELWLGESNVFNKIELDQEWIINVFKKSKSKNQNITFVFGMIFNSEIPGIDDEESIIKV